MNSNLFLKSFAAEAEAWGAAEDSGKLLLGALSG